MATLSGILGSQFSGSTGPAGTISIGTVTSGGAASVTNVGTPTAAVLNFNLPVGTFTWPSSGIPVSTGSAWGTSLTVPSGSLVGTTATQTLTNKTFNVANNTFVITAAQLASIVTDETGSGSLVFATSPTLSSPTLVTPTLGVASATSINKVAITAPTTSATLTIADGKTLTASNTVTLTGTDGTSYNLDALTSIPQNAQSAGYTFVLSDAGKAVIQSGSSTTVTIPANSSVAYPVGTTLTVVNNTAGNISIAITTDTMYLGGTATTGTRTLAQRGIATAYKVSSTVWFISGAGLT